MIILPIKKSADFKKNNQIGKKIHTHSFIFICCKTNQFYNFDGTYKKAKVFCRFGVVVSKSVSKKSVERNLIKRRLRSAFRLSFDLKSNRDYIFIAKQPILKFDYLKIKQDIDYALTKVANL
jgi:ribonuclease P protein component